MTPSFNYVTSVTLRQTQPPARLALTKYYFRPQVESLKAQMDEVHALGQAALEEWYKGLEETGQAQLADAARFEQWDLSPASQMHFDPGAPHRMSISSSTSPSATSPAHSMDSSAVYSHQMSMASPHYVPNMPTPQHIRSQPGMSLVESLIPG